MDSRLQMQQESPSTYGTNRFLPTYLNLAMDAGDEHWICGSRAQANAITSTLRSA